MVTKCPDIQYIGSTSMTHKSDIVSGENNSTERILKSDQLFNLKLKKKINTVVASVLDNASVQMKS